MNQKILIVLFVTIFYNGVVYASPVSERNPEVILPETAKSSAVSSPVSQEPSAKFIHTENTEDEVDKITSGLLDSHSKSTPVPPEEFTVKNVTHDMTSKNATSVIEDKKSNVNADNKNNNQTIDNKSLIPNKTVSAPVEVPPSANSPALTTNQTLNSSTVPSNVDGSTITTSKINTSAQPEVTTASPNCTNSEKVVVHDVHTPVEEKHFDGPSFIGGMILTIGLTAIGFIAFKYYKSGKIDMNYRTL